MYKNNPQMRMFLDLHENWEKDLLLSETTARKFLDACLQLDWYRPIVEAYQMVVAESKPRRRRLKRQREAITPEKSSDLGGLSPCPPKKKRKAIEPVRVLKTKNTDLFDICRAILTIFPQVTEWVDGIPGMREKILSEQPHAAHFITQVKRQPGWKSEVTKLEAQAKARSQKRRIQVMQM